MAPAASRVRTSFDPEHELPQLHQWFAENPHPSRLTLQMYVRELNGLPSRQTRKPLEVHNLCYWFKNARAAYKRAETRMRRESAEPTLAAANSSQPHHHFSCQPHTQQQHQYQKTNNLPHQHLTSHPLLLQQQQQQRHNHLHQINSNDKLLLLSGSSSSSPSGSPPSSMAVGVDAELAALKLAAAAAAAATVVPPAAVANLAAAASLKSLLAATGRSAQAAPVPQPPVPPLAPFSELDPDRSLYLLLFFMKLFDLDTPLDLNAKPGPNKEEQLSPLMICGRVNGPQTPF